MSYAIIFDFVLKSIAFLSSICFMIYLVINEIKQVKKDREFLRNLRKIEKQFDNADEEIKEFVHAYVDAMEEILTM